MKTLTAGQEITAFNTYPKEWWSEESNFLYGKVYPLVVTGVITKVFKNGTLLVAINEMRNGSEDGKRSMHVNKDDLVNSWISM